ncbi:MAG TPA: 50S ribosomal protein L35 [Deltaproteobacteria bacterium]|nr:MAG: 50S ribosomal protein L35 [Deltaproteobacteria bacterium GWA2_55_82]OGQ63855.1 MAG: 50S ribosomal protein L35 [Deltaproteobacteria bacterium RIFCSPLOWO2_02_FULL_55_12]OIJ72685.1 MAG: 50S ribosomal protein L35 [Deltaproteobacteria bacterium GWC2_55_46]HBG47595.1 50S ribosomal protein L35 [Deltaproteobacteria bacterium]HCY10506.1 50S ribosomal protein L35 [Deltaproteobacteria bacterium]
MPKLKTNSGAAKRFKITGSGKVKRNKSGMRHLLTSKAKKTKRVLRKSGLISATHEDSIKKLLPYG